MYTGQHINIHYISNFNITMIVSFSKKVLQFGTQPAMTCFGFIFERSTDIRQS
jgi:hypothetical protein